MRKILAALGALFLSIGLASASEMTLLGVGDGGAQSMVAQSLGVQLLASQISTLTMPSQPTAGTACQGTIALRVKGMYNWGVSYAPGNISDSFVVQPGTSGQDESMPGFDLILDTGSGLRLNAGAANHTGASTGNSANRYFPHGSGTVGSTAWTAAFYDDQWNNLIYSYNWCNGTTYYGVLYNNNVKQSLTLSGTDSLGGSGSAFDVAWNTLGGNSSGYSTTFYTVGNSQGGADNAYFDVDDVIIDATTAVVCTSASTPAACAVSNGCALSTGGPTCAAGMIPDAVLRTYYSSGKPQRINKNSNCNALTGEEPWLCMTTDGGGALPTYSAANFQNSMVNLCGGSPCGTANNVSTGSGQLLGMGTLTPGSGCADSTTYTGVTLTGGGTGATATVTTSATGTVSGVGITAVGSGYSSTTSVTGTVGTCSGWSFLPLTSPQWAYNSFYNAPIAQSGIPPAGASQLNGAIGMLFADGGQGSSTTGSGATVTATWGNHASPSGDVLIMAIETEYLNAANSVGYFPASCPTNWTQIGNPVNGDQSSLTLCWKASYGTTLWSNETTGNPPCTGASAACESAPSFVVGANSGGALVGVGAITGGSGCANSTTYENVALTASSGSGAYATVETNGSGAVSNVSITSQGAGGSGYTQGEAVSGTVGTCSSWSFAAVVYPASAVYASWVIADYTNVDTTNPVDAYALLGANQAQSSTTPPQVITSYPNDVVATFAMLPTVSGGNYVLPPTSGMNLRYNITSSGSTSVEGAMWDVGQASVGQSAAQTFTQHGTATPAVMATVALKPAIATQTQVASGTTITLTGTGYFRTTGTSSSTLRCWGAGGGGGGYNLNAPDHGAGGGGSYEESDGVTMSAGIVYYNFPAGPPGWNAPTAWSGSDGWINPGTNSEPSGAGGNCAAGGGAGASASSSSANAAGSYKYPCSSSGSCSGSGYSGYAYTGGTGYGSSSGQGGGGACGQGSSGAAGTNGSSTASTPSNCTGSGGSYTGGAGGYGSSGNNGTNGASPGGGGGGSNNTNKFGGSGGNAQGIITF